jgi:hypothetical protein
MSPEVNLTPFDYDPGNFGEVCAGEPSAGTRRRSNTPTRRLGGCADEGSGMWILLITKVDILRSGVSQAISE